MKWKELSCQDYETKSGKGGQIGRKGNGTNSEKK